MKVLFVFCSVFVGYAVSFNNCCNDPSSVRECVAGNFAEIMELLKAGNSGCGAKLAKLDPLYIDYMPVDQAVNSSVSKLTISGLCHYEILDMSKKDEEDNSAVLKVKLKLPLVKGSGIYTVDWSKKGFFNFYTSGRSRFSFNNLEVDVEVRSTYNRRKRRVIYTAVSVKAKPIDASVFCNGKNDNSIKCNVGQLNQFLYGVTKFYERNILVGLNEIFKKTSNDDLICYFPSDPVVEPVEEPVYDC